MEITLAPEIEAYVGEKVASGEYNSPSELMSDVLQKFRRQEIEELRREVGIGLEQLKRGEYTTYNDETLKQFFEDIKAHGRLRRDIAIGVAQADRGEVAPLDMEAIKAEARQRFAEETRP